MAGGVGGGGAATNAGYPLYMQDWHESVLALVYDPLTDSGYLRDAQTQSPYATIEAVDPSDTINAVIGRNSEFGSFVDGINPIDLWQEFIDNTISSFDGALLSEEDIDFSVRKFESAQTKRSMRSLSRITAGYSDINAVAGSAFPTAIAIWEGDLRGSIDQYEANLRLRVSQDRITILGQALQSMVGVWTAQLESMYRTVQTTIEVEKMKLIAIQEEQEQNLQYSIADITWPLEMLTYGGNTLASIVGAAVVPRPLPKWQSALSGAITGIATFAPLGAQIGGVEGALIAAIAGAVLMGAFGWATGV